MRMGVGGSCRSRPYAYGADEEYTNVVIPAKAGIHSMPYPLDPDI